MEKLEDRTVPASFDPTTGIGFDDAGRQYVAEIVLPDLSRREPTDPAPGRGRLDPTNEFQLHSRPGAARVIYLDFTGHTTTGTAWNSQSLPSIVTPPYSADADTSTFSNLELSRIRGIWQRAVEDFSSFDVDVTTEDPGLAALVNSGGGDNEWGIRVVIGGNGLWTGGGYGGIAYIGSFGWDVDTCTFVFTDNLGAEEKYTAEAVSHEVGHTLGLAHDGRTSPPEEYYAGHGGGDTGWAPIMGVGYYQELVQWSRGEYMNASNGQDDLAVIARPFINFDYLPDDAGDTTATATPLTGSGSSLTFAGVIERTTDVDVLSFTAGTGPATFGVDNHLIAPNLDVRLELWDAAGSLIWADDAPDVTDAAISIDLSAGTYFLAVQGVGRNDPFTPGYSDYGSLGQYTVTATVTELTTLTEIESTPLSYVEGHPGLPLTATAIVNSFFPIQSARVTISAGYMADQDTLLFTPAGGITGSFEAATGVLTLTGTATAAQYTTVLRSVQYRNSSDDPVIVTRTFTLQVTNAIGSSTPVRSRNMTLTAVNDPPTLDVVADRVLDEDAGQDVISLLGISAGGESQPVTVVATSSDPALLPDPTVTYAGGDTGMLTFTPVADRSGTVTITVTLSDPGGTANGGADTLVREFVVTVRPVNDAPILVGGANPSVPRDAGPQQVSGWATTLLAGPLDEAGQALTVLVETDRPDLFATLPNVTSNGMLTFEAAPGAVGLATVTLRLQDNGGTANGGVDTSAPVTFLMFIGVNRAPTLDAAADAELFPVGEGATDPNGTPIGAFAFNGYADLDPDDPRGVAVTGLTGTDFGRWEFSTDGGEIWQNLEGASSTDARLLGAVDRVRFVPDAGYTGRPTLTFHGWDGTIGVPGGAADVGVHTLTSAFSADVETAVLRVAPVIARFNEDAKPGSTRLAAYTTGHVIDPDPSARRGLAVVWAGGDLPGVWQYSTNGGLSWRPLVPDRAHARLLRDTDRVRFVPARDANGDAFLKVAAWDQSAGAAGSTADLRLTSTIGGQSSFSAADDFLVVRVAPANDKPVLDAKTAATLTRVDPTAPTGIGDRVGTLLGATVVDPDAGTVAGIAVTKVGKGGAWEYQLNGAGQWTAFPQVSARAGLLLGPDDRVRFIPDAGFVGTSTLTYKAWDRSTLQTPGTVTNPSRGTAFSTATESAVVTVSTDPGPPANQSPILDSFAMSALPDMAEGSPLPGSTVGALLGAAVTDADAGALRGIAVTGVSEVGGKWQYSTNGRTWLTIGTVSQGRALLLRETDRIRFLPTLDWFGDATITFFAWDQTRGTAGGRANLAPTGTTGGDAPFSASRATVRVTVTPTNDLPVLAVRKGVIFTKVGPAETDPDGNAVADLIGGRVTDVDPGAVVGIAITRIRQGIGTWEISLNGGAAWVPLNAPGAGEAVLLRAQDRMRFVPFVGQETTAAISYRAWDRTSGSPGTSTSLAALTSVGRATETATVAVTAQSSRPRLDVRPVVQLDPVAVGDDEPAGTEVSRVLGGVFDPDAGAVSGIAVTGTAGAGGVWQYSLDGGTTWTALPPVTSRSALLLRRTDLIRFVPAASFSGQARLSFKAWDQPADGDTWAGRLAPTQTTSFSTATETAVVSVNTAPTLA